MRKLLIGLVALIGLAAVVVVGGYFALRRPDIPLPTLEQKYAAEDSTFVELPDGVRMHYRDGGNAEGPVVVLVHGFSSALMDWDPWTERLGDRYRMVRLDLPGHGLTTAPAGYRASIEHYVDEVEAFAQALQLERFTIVGSSMGGNISWEYALKHPERVQAMVLVDSSGWEETRAGLDQDPPIFKLLRTPVIGPAMAQLDSTKLIRQGLENSVHDPAFVTDDLVARYGELARAPGHRDILLQMTLSFRERRYATNEVLTPIRVPTLILHGEEDKLVPSDHARKFAAAIAGSELVTWTDEGHMAMLEHPDRSALAVGSFLDRVYAQAPQTVTQAP